MTTGKNKNQMTQKEIDGAAVALGVGVGLALVSAIGSSGAALGIAIAVGFRTALKKRREQEMDDSKQQ